MRENLPEFRVAITDLDQVVAASGMEWNSLPLLARKAMESGKRAVERDASELCGSAKYRERAMIAAPLTCGEECIGSLLFCVPQGPNLILEADCRTAESLAQFFSALLELAEFQHQIQLRQQAELRASSPRSIPIFCLTPFPRKPRR